MNFINMFMPLIVKFFELYISNSSSKKDDEVLKMVQKGASYLACKENNDVIKSDITMLKDKRVYND